MRLVLRWIVGIVIGLVVALMTAWCAGAIYYSRPGGSRAGIVLALAFAVAPALAFILLPRRGWTLVGFLVVFAAVVVWWILIPATNERDWQAEVAVSPWVSQDGDRITI